MKTSTRLLLCISLSMATIVRADLHTGLVSYWPLDAAENGGTTTPDPSFGNTMNIVGAPVVSPGQFGNAFTFDGTTTYLINNHTFDNVATGLPVYQAGSYTVSMWVRGAAQTAKYLYCEGSSTNNTPLLVLQTGQSAVNNNKLDIFIRPLGGGTPVNHIVSSNVVFDNTWHHIAWVEDNGVGRIYVDGNLDPTGITYARSGTMPADISTIGVLARNPVPLGGVFNGQIDEVAVWERALSQAEINELRTNGISTPIPPRAPTLTVTPASAVKRVGDWHRFSAFAFGSRPISYQWNMNGSPIPGANDSTYFVPHLTTNESGDFYSVTVSNTGGETSSTNAVLTVLPDPAPDVVSGLVSYWPLNEVTNLTSPDLYSGYHMVLNFMDEFNLVPGQFGNALIYDGLEEYTRRTNGFAIYQLTDFSLSFWVKADGTFQNDRRIFSEGSSTSATPLFTIGTHPSGANQSLSVFIRDDANSTRIAGRTSTRTALDDVWHHVVWTDANGQGKLYIDGVLDETDYSYSRSTLTLDITSLGAVVRAAPGNWFFGNIDEVATWNRVLSWTEIQQVMTSGIPDPTNAIPPGIATQPVDQTNNVFQGDTVLFSVVATGTSPLNYQWRKDGSNIPGAGNPTALTDTLMLTNVQPADSGSTYSVVVANAGGSITSSVVQLAVTPYTPATNGEVLAIDIGLTGSPNTQPGFSEFNLGMNGTNFNAIGVTFSPIGGSLEARNRTPSVTNNPPALTQAQIYNDFIFANTTATGNGMSVLITRLAPNTTYGVTLWSFDSGSTGNRVADWTETASGATNVIVEGYTFNGSALPTQDSTYTFEALLTSSASGQLRLEGRNNAASAGALGVFLNAIRLVANPTIALQITGVELVGGNIRLTIDTQTPGQPVNIEQRPDIAGGAWSPATGGGITATNGQFVTAEFSITGPQMFYRAIRP